MEYLNEKRDLLKLASKSTPHCSNLLEKTKIENLSGEKKSFLFLAVKTNIKYLKEFILSSDSELSYIKYIKNIDSYMNFLRRENRNFFSHQSDMISSVLPEMFCQIFEKKKKALGLKEINVSGQEDLKIDFQIKSSSDEPLSFKSKRVDVCIYKKAEMTFNGKKHKIIIPLISIENKVNLDKNMLYGIINTSSSIKNIFPGSKYYVYTEFSDLTLDKHNYGYSDIDEVFTLRKQNRGSFRKTKNANPIDYSLITDALTIFENMFSSNSNNFLSIEERMQKFGKLIIK